jgi:hypothetical protein
MSISPAKESSLRAGLVTALLPWPSPVVERSPPL